MIDLNKNFKFTIEYTVDENGKWKISYDSDDELTEDDVDSFMGHILLLKKKRWIEKMEKERKEKYDSLSFFQKLKSMYSGIPD